MIREMNDKDVPIISRVFKSANPHANISEIEEWTLSNLHEAEGVYLILEKDGEIIGGISSFILNGAGIIDDIAIKNNLRRKGYGSKLIIDCVYKLWCIK